MRKVVIVLSVTLGILLCGAVVWWASPRAVSHEKRSGVEQLPQTKGTTVEEEGFHFPDDQAGVLLAKVLTPSEMRPTAERTKEPQRHPGSPRVETPSLPLPPNKTDIPHITMLTKRTPQPHLVMEEVFLAAHAEAVLPAAVVLAAAERVRVPSVDVNKPIPLPILAKPSSDRAPLEDATTDASNAAALLGTAPSRTKPAPFLKLTLPDPFENRRPVRSPVTPSEDVPNSTPRLPKP